MSVELGEMIAGFLKENFKDFLEIAKKEYQDINESVELELKTAYTSYLERTYEKYAKSKSFFIRDKSVDLYSYYVPTGIKTSDTHILTPSFSDTIAHSNHIIITGTGGSGKSVLLKHLFLDCIKEKRYTPVMIELRELNNTKQKLDEHINATLETYGFNTSGNYILKAKRAGGFCFFFDGYDEVNHKRRKQLIKQIKSLANKYKECPIVISSRPDDVFNGIEDFHIFEIQPLTLKSASTLISKLPFDEDIKKKFTADLQKELFKKHKSFLSNPLLLSIMLLTYGEHAHIPSKLSIFYNQAYEALFQRHDANKSGYRRERSTTLDIQDFSKVFSLFALQTYEKRLLKMPRTKCLSFIEKSKHLLQNEFKAEDYLDDLLGAACLLIEDGLEVAFSHRSFQEYFVALYIASAQPEIQKELIDRYWENIESDNVISLLHEINPELVERLLYLPKLEKLFTHIGVKKKVGVTHTAKYIKYFNEEIRIEELDITCKIKNFPFLLLLHQVLKDYSSFIYTRDNKLDHKIYAKYGEKTYDVSTLSYKTPIMIDLMKGYEFLSIDFLTALFTVYKKLKSKHEKQRQSLDSLLGL